MVSARLKGTTDIAGSSIQLEHESKQATLQITAVSSLMNTDTTTTVKTIDFAFQTPLSSSTPLLFTSTGSCMLQSCSFKSPGSVVTAQTLISFLSLAIGIASPSISVGDVTFNFCSFTGTLPTSFCWDSLVHILLHHFLSLVIF
ncbi:hypothetical protein BLNAU_21511 [Blattamonas nauphoetae]|uniref:Uncharacterized protein n=1 Tax=Blattamonas nauphoetae TaxID=2049346 RepID=A0ABQ9WVQ1_9EUKA|nr:hypothetical protein BLNAU_21511 [Blattamonas nauphoetae]